MNFTASNAPRRNWRTHPPTVHEISNSFRAAIRKRYRRRPEHFLRHSRPRLDQLLIPIAGLWINAGKLRVGIFRLDVFGDNLNEETTHIDGADCSFAKPQSGPIRNREVRAVNSDVPILIDPPKPYARLRWNDPPLPHRGALGLRVEHGNAVPHFGRIVDDRGLNGPFPKQSLTARIDLDWLAVHHRFQRRNVLLLKLAHPCVVARMADGIDCLLGVVGDDLRPCAFLHLEWAEFLVPVNPCGPDVFLAAGFVVAEYAGREWLGLCWYHLHG